MLIRIECEFDGLIMHRLNSSTLPRLTEDQCLDLFYDYMMLTSYAYILQT